jgi:hypothetical protein
MELFTVIMVLVVLHAAVFGLTGLVLVYLPNRAHRKQMLQVLKVADLELERLRYENSWSR